MVADKLKAAGVPARVEHVQSPQLADAGGDLGYRVGAGNFATKADGAGTVNRVPGLIRNCGGTDDTPTNLPLHDFACMDADEIVAFTS